jgi:hypothetical protein
MVKVESSIDMLTVVGSAKHANFHISSRSSLGNSRKRWNSRRGSPLEDGEDVEFEETEQDEERAAPRPSEGACNIMLAVGELCWDEAVTVPKDKK